MAIDNRKAAAYTRDFKDIVKPQKVPGNNPSITSHDIDVILQQINEAFRNIVSKIYGRIGQDDFNIVTQDYINNKVSQSDYALDQNGVWEKIGENFSQIQQNAEAISLKVSQNDYDSALEDINGLMSELSSAITQTSKSIETMVTQATFNEKTNSMEQNISDVTQTAEYLTVNFTNISNTVSGNSEAINEINEYIRFEGANIYLGKSTSPLILHISNDRIAYEYDNIEATFFADKKMAISYNGSEQKVEIGVDGDDPYISIYDENGIVQINLTKAGIELGGNSMITPFTVGTLSGIAIFA